MRAGKNEDAGRLIINLGDMLRAALSPKQNTTAAADVQLVRSYIEIQQLRYKRRAVFTLDADGALESWHLPHFTLQPLVENAIKYGVEESEDVCEITVTAHAEADTLLLAVHNTGTPIDTARLAEIRNFTVKPQGHGIGLKNIYERLSMLYKTFAFTVDSTETDGTTVQIISSIGRTQRRNNRMEKLLIVDDEEIELDGMAELIDWPSYGYELVGTAINGKRGLALIQEKQPDIVITDIKMPVMDGLAMIRAAQEQHVDKVLQWC